MDKLTSRTRGFFVYAMLLCAASLVSAQEFKPGAHPPLEIGSPAAEFRIEIFNDFRCPASAAFFKQYKELVAKYPDRVLVTFRHFPLRKDQSGLLAAKAIEAAAAQGNFLAMMTMIYDNQEALKKAGPTTEIFTSYAKTIGLDTDRFNADIDGQQAIDRINFDLERAKMLGVTGTPWVLLNERPMPFGEAQDMETTIFGASKR